MAELDSAAAVVARISSATIDDRVLLGIVALVMYEHLVTLGTEIRLFWRREITGASILFFVNRYLILLHNLLSLRLYWSFASSVSMCSQFLYAHKTSALLDYIPWAGFSALRVFALAGGNWLLAFIVFVLSLGPVVINFVSFHWSIIVNDPLYGCFQVDNPPAAVSLGFVIISRVTLIAADLIVIAVTWFATYKIASARNVLNHDHQTFSALLLRDGTFYFLVMLSMNVLHLAFSTSPVLIALDQINISYVTQFSEPLTSILISRFMMNLQEARQDALGSIGESGSCTPSSVQFDRVVGSIGESLEPSIVERDFHV